MRSSQVERTEPLGWAIDVFITRWKDKYTGGYLILKKWSMVWRGHLWLLCGLGEIWLFWVLSGALISTERPTRAHFSCWRSKLVQGAGTRKGSIEKGQKTSFNEEDKINKPKVNSAHSTIGIPIKDDEEENRKGWCRNWEWKEAERKKDQGGGWGELGNKGDLPQRASGAGLL